MIKPVFPIKRGAKAPPLLQEWQNASLEELEEILARHYHNCNYGLRLDDYVTLDPDDQKAADYLDLLEKGGHLPSTWTWTTWRGMKIRLYRRPEGERSFNIKDDRMDLQIRMGSGQYCLIPNSQVKNGTYAWVPGRSLTDLDLADLPAATLEMLKQLKLERCRTLKENVIIENTNLYRAPTDPGEQIRRIMERCTFLQHCDRDRTALSEPEWFGMITQFCRLPGGDQWIHQLSQGYPKYSVAETDKKIRHAAADSPGPHTCAHIKVLYDCRRSCGVRAPVDHGNPEKPAHCFNLVRVNDLVKQSQPETQWLWEGILPQGGLSINVAKPKVGKSTISLNLAAAVVKGNIFLGRATIQVPVVYLALEEKGAELQKRLIGLGIEDAPLYLHIGMAPENGLKQIDALVESTGAGLLIIDTMQKLVRIHDLNDYAQVTNALEPLLGVARERNCHIMLTHHAGKAERKDGDEILGSTAILGAVDTAIILKKRDQARTFSTIQRYGDDVPETLLLLNPDYSLTIGGTMEEAKEKEIWNKIRTVIEAHPEITEPEIVTQTECRGADTSRVLRWALNQDLPLLQRHGAGKKGDPYRYFLPPVPPIYSREGEKQKDQSPVSVQNNINYSSSGVLHEHQDDGREKVLGKPQLQFSRDHLEAWDEAIKMFSINFIQCPQDIQYGEAHTLH